MVTGFGGFGILSADAANPSGFVALVNPLNGLPSAGELSGASCSSAGHCVAVGLDLSNAAAFARGQPVDVGCRSGAGSSRSVRRSTSSASARSFSPSRVRRRRSAWRSEGMATLSRSCWPAIRRRGLRLRRRRSRSEALSARSSRNSRRSPARHRRRASRSVPTGTSSRFCLTATRQRGLPLRRSRSISAREASSLQ